MINWAIFIIIIISLVSGAYSIVLLYRLRSNYKLEFLNSYFYYQLLLFVFGLYAILGNILLKQILLKFDIERQSLEAITHFIPFIGIPFIIAAWYMLLKVASELISKKIPQYVPIIYFLFSTAAFLVYGLLIKNMPEKTEANFEMIEQNVHVVFYLVELVVISYVVLYLLIHSVKENDKNKRQFVFRFAGIALGITILSSVGLHFAYVHILIGLYFILLFFAGNLPTIFLTKVYLERNNEKYLGAKDEMEYLFQKYGISKREKEIIGEIRQGKTNQQIADDLFISLQTVKDHTHNIFKKAGVKNRTQLAQLFSE